MFSSREMTTSTGYPDDLSIPTGSTESILFSTSSSPQLTTEEATDSPPIPVSDNYGMKDRGGGAGKGKAPEHAYP